MALRLLGNAGNERVGEGGREDWEYAFCPVVGKDGKGGHGNIRNGPLSLLRRERRREGGHFKESNGHFDCGHFIINKLVIKIN